MDIQGLTAFLSSVPDTIVPGFECSVHVEGRPVFHYRRKFTDASMFWLYSCTKVFTCTAIMKLIEENRIGLYDDLCSYFPEFSGMKVWSEGKAVPTEKKIRIYDLLKMCSGFDYELEDPAIQKIISSEKPAGESIAFLSEKVLLFEPDTDFKYSLSHDILGAVIEKVTGKSLGQYLSEAFFLPLGITHTGFDPEVISDRSMEKQYFFDEERKELIDYGAYTNEYRFHKNYHSGGAGLVSTMDDVCSFADMLANGGIAENGKVLISPSSIALMGNASLNTKELQSFHKDWDYYRNYSYGLGVRTYCFDTPGAKGSHGEFGWCGAAGSYLLIDPAHRLSLFFAMHVRNCSWVCYHLFNQLRDLLY